MSRAYSRSQTPIKRNESVGVNAAQRRSSVSQSVLRALRSAGGVPHFEPSRSVSAPRIAVIGGDTGYRFAFVCHYVPPALHVLAFAVHVLRDRP